MDLWDWSLEATCDTEIKVRLQGEKACMSSFQFLSKKRYLILMIPKVRMTFLNMIIQKPVIAN